MITQLIFHFSSNLNIELRGTGENTACLNIFFGRIVDYMVNIFKSNRDTIEVYLGANQTFMMKLFDRLLNKLLHKNDVNRHITRESSGRRETPTLFNLCLPFLIIFIPLQLPLNNWLFCKAFINRLDIYIFIYSTAAKFCLLKSRSALGAVQLVKLQTLSKAYLGPSQTSMTKRFSRQ